MPRFIPMKDGAYVNADRIVTMHDRKIKDDQGHERGLVEVEYLGADGRVTRGVVAEDLIDADDLAVSFGHPIVPAGPGYYCVNLKADPPHRLAREVVLAWRVEELGLEPLGITGELYGDLLLPDGRVESILESWDSIEEWRADKLESLGEDDDDDEEEEDEDEEDSDE